MRFETILYMTADGSSLPELDRDLALLARRDGSVQIGWTPERSVLVRTPDGVDADSMIAALSLLDGRRSVPDILWQAAEHGIDASDMQEIVRELEDVSIVRRTVAGASLDRSATVLIIGRGPLSDAIAIGLGPQAAVDRRIKSLPRRETHYDCVVLADDLVPRPETVSILMRSGTAHIPIRLRDGRGVVGPLVLPRHTSCLRCVDLTRCDYDPEWPHLAAQMVGRVGSAGPATTSMTAAVAVAHVGALLSGPPTPAPPSLGRSLEIDAPASTIRHRRWAKHRLCDCGSATGGRSISGDRQP